MRVPLTKPSHNHSQNLRPAPYYSSDNHRRQFWPGPRRASLSYTNEETGTPPANKPHPTTDSLCMAQMTPRPGQPPPAPTAAPRRHRRHRPPPPTATARCQPLPASRASRDRAEQVGDAAPAESSCRPQLRTTARQLESPRPAAEQRVMSCFLSPCVLYIGPYVRLGAASSEPAWRRELL